MERKEDVDVEETNSVKIDIGKNNRHATQAEATRAVMVSTNRDKQVASCGPGEVPHALTISISDVQSQWKPESFSHINLTELPQLPNKDRGLVQLQLPTQFKEEASHAVTMSINDVQSQSELESFSHSDSELNTELPQTREIKRKNDDKGESSKDKSGFERFINNLELEKTFEPTPMCCIYSVPEDLRKINKEAYKPEVVSIGLLLYNDMGMDIKKRYIKRFIERKGGRDRLEDFWSHIKNKEERIRACYAKSFQDINTSDHQFVNRILNDVVFIFELFLMDDQGRSRTTFDTLLDTPSRKAAVIRDLQLLENQIPYFVFKELFIKLGASVWSSAVDYPHSSSILALRFYPDSFLILALRFFYGSERKFFCDGNHNQYVIQDLKHFTDLRRRFLLKEFIPPTSTPKGPIRDLRSATKLHNSGVKFKKGVNEDRSSLQVSCEYIKRSLKMIPCIKLQELELQIPRFEVYDDTECLIRNVVAFEQLHYPCQTHICNYILLMDSLIDTEKDVDLLVDKEIIYDGLGDKDRIAKMFNGLGSHVLPSCSCYYDIGVKLKEHYDKPWNHAKGTLKHVYFNGPWKAAGTIAAVLLLLLTLVQTVCSILQVL